MTANTFHIVPEEEILTEEEVMAETWSLMSLSRGFFTDTAESLKFFAKRGLIRNSK